MNITLTAADILSIPVLEPERLFGTPEAIHDVYRALARRWHPDAPSGNAEVFTHVAALHTRAKHLADTGMWHVPGMFEFTSDRKQYRIRYLRSFDFELGQVLLGRTLLTYVLRKEFADLAANARKLIGDLRFPDRETERVMRPYLPKLTAYHETSTDIVLTIDKPADLIRLRDLRDHLGGKLDPKHIGWIVSRLLNHASYLEWMKFSHNDLSLDTVFICPEHHTICLLGGWWYAVPLGDSLKGRLLPTRTITHGPTELLNKRIASARTDPELARLTARELLGDASGVHLAIDKALPKSMVDWLRMSGSGSALTDYTQWRENVLPASFGPRKFVKLSVAAEDVYTELAT